MPEQQRAGSGQILGQRRQQPIDGERRQLRCDRRRLEIILPLASCTPANPPPLSSFAPKPLPQGGGAASFNADPSSGEGKEGTASFAAAPPPADDADAGLLAGLQKKLQSLGLAGVVAYGEQCRLACLLRACRRARSGLRAPPRRRRPPCKRRRADAWAILLGVGLFNTLYYTGAFAFFWHLAKVPRGQGLAAAARSFAVVFGGVYAGSQARRRGRCRRRWGAGAGHAAGRGMPAGCSLRPCIPRVSEPARGGRSSLPLAPNPGR